MNSRIYSFFHPDLTHGSIVKSLVSFTIPLIISYLFQQLYNTVDTIIVGHFLGEQSLAAIGSCVAINELFIGFGNGFGNGLGIVAARAYGACNIDKLKRVSAGAIVITAGVTVFISISGFFFLKPLLKLLKTPEEIISEAYSYISVIVSYAGVLFFYNLFAALLRSIGNSFMPLVFLILSSLMNIGLDILFITRFNMGIKGTAIATVTAQGISVLLCMVYILKKTAILIPSENSWKIDSYLYKDLLGQGISMALMSALVSSGSVILQSSINKFGTSIIAGHISARKLFGLTIIPLITLGTASATFVSQNRGAEQIERIKKGVKTADLLCILWGILCCLVIPFTSRFLIRFMSGSDNEQVLWYGSKYISFMQPFYAVLGVLFVTRNSLQGLGSKILPLISSFIELAGKIIFTWIIIPHTSTWGIIMCEPLIWVFMTIQLLFVFLRHPLIKGKNSPAKADLK